MEEEQAATVRGLTTVSKTRVLEENGEWLASVIYYDDYARSVQTQTQQMGGEWDMMTNLYDFSGKVLKTHQEHQSQIEPIIVKQNFEYDHAGRLLKTFHQVNQEPIILLSNVRYNEVGQVKGKGLHQATPLQDITFKYNIRGWLTHINELENVQIGNPTKLFAFQIYYDEAGQFNGNIGSVEWKTTTDAVQRGYKFDYDKLNRLKQARYFNDGTSRYDDEDYTVSNIEYDQNGNILSLARKGLLKMSISEKDPTQIEKSYGQIDDLYYSYSENYNGIRSNRLRSVSDYASQSFGLAGDFQDNNQTSSLDYEYDLNGNLLVDNNKGIGKILYNHLNLPEIIKFETGNIILNTYDAAGIKLKSEIVENGVPLRTTYYKNGFIYEQKSTDPELQLSFFGTAEGRIVKKEERFVYEYHYKDHLGNLRVAFQAQEATPEQRQVLTMELDKAETEEQEFENVRVVRSSKKDKQGHYSAELTNANQPISKTLQVKKGDRIKASVFATHDPAIAETDPEKAITEAKKDVLLSLGSAAAGTLNTNPIDLKVDIPVNPEISPAQTMITKSPKVQLNLLDFVPVIRNLRALKKAKKAKILEPDTYFVPKGELVLELRDSTDSLIFEKREKLTISSAVSWEKLMSNLEIKEDGNLSVYIDNSSSDKVYFDEFIIERTEATVAVVVQENHYYPFGMNMKGIEELDIQSLDGNDEHRFQYNGKEKIMDFGLYWNDHGARNVDLQLGRWWGVDPLAEKYLSISSYVSMANNPLMYIDLDGREIDIAVIDEWMKQRNNVETKRDEIQNQIDIINSIGNEFGFSEGLNNLQQGLESRVASLNSSIETLNSLESSKQVYTLNSNNNGVGGTTYDPTTGYIVLSYGGNDATANFLHEAVHAGQFETQDIGFNPNGTTLGADVYDEVAAYKAQYTFSPQSVSGLLSNSVIKSESDITVNWLQNITLQNGDRLYAPQGSANTAIVPVDMSSDKNALIRAYPHLQNVLQGLPENTPIKEMFPTTHYKK